MRRLIVGCGYLGGRVAKLWSQAGDSVHVVTRSADRAREFRAAGFGVIIGDVTEPDSLAMLPDCDTVLHAVGFDRASGLSRRQVYVDGLSNVLGAIAGRCGHLVHVSSSSVYGQEAGEVVTEDSPCEPQHESGQVCLEAEQLVERVAATHGLRATVLRMSGLYGPQRLLSRAEALRDRVPLPGPADAWLNLIHIDDAATVTTHIAEIDTGQRLFLVSDDQPVPRGEYYRTLARLVGAPDPVFDDSAIARHTRGLNKRCSNSRLRSIAGLTLRYPTIHQGLPHAVQEQVQ